MTSTSDKKVATVAKLGANGIKIKAKKAGAVTVKARLRKKARAKTVKVKVTVKEKKAPEPSATPLASAEPTATPVAVASAEPTATGVASVAPSERPYYVYLPGLGGSTGNSTASPAPEMPTKKPDGTNAPAPTAEPTATPAPTTEPTAEPTAEPDPTDTPAPTTEPTAEPTAEPDPTDTPAPTAEPTAEPDPTDTPAPTTEPTAEPTMATVTFVIEGAIAKAEKVAGGEGLAAPDTYRGGVEFLYWELNGETFTTDGEDLQNAIKALTLQGVDVKVVACYKALAYYSIVASGGALRIDEEPNADGKYPAKTKYSVDPEEREGEIFSHWMVNGKRVDVVSNDDLSYSDILIADMEIEAVFVPDGTEVDRKPTITLDNIYGQVDSFGRYLLNFAVRSVIPDGYTIKGYGIIWTRKDASLFGLEDNLYGLFYPDEGYPEPKSAATLVGSVGYIKGTGSTELVKQTLALNVTNYVSDKSIIEARAFLIVEDGNGNKFIVYDNETATTKTALEDMF